MSEQPLYLSQLHQIPVFALQDKICTQLHENVSSEEIADRFERTLNIRPRNSKSACSRLTREQLIKLIAVSPEISPESIQALFLAYQYGNNPSLCVYVFDKCGAPLIANLEELTKAFKCEFEKLDDEDDEEDVIQPTTRHLQLNRDLQLLVKFDSVIEGNYRFLRRLDYIDDYQDAMSTYETKYGYFWINTDLGYVAIHGRHNTIIKAICSTFELVTGISLVALDINKQFRDMLSFLKHALVRSSKYRNSDHTSGSIHSVTVTGEDLDLDELRQFDERFTELSHRRYRLHIDDDKISSVSVSDDGSISVMGRITATQFRNWSLSALQEVMEVWGVLRKTPDSHLKTIDLDSSLEFRLLRTRKKKNAFLEILRALLTLQTGPDESVVQLSISPLALAEAFGAGVKIQIPFTCRQEGCSEEGYYKCVRCGSDGFRVSNSNGWRVKCLNPDHRSSVIPLPLRGECEKTHQYVLDKSDFESSVEIFFHADLLQLLEKVVKKYIREHSFDSTQERFYIKGRTFMYQTFYHIHSAQKPPTQITKHYHAEHDINLIESGKIDAGILKQGGKKQIPECTNDPESK